MIGALIDIGQAAANTISAAIDAIVDAFVAWAINFVCDMFSTLIAQPLQALYNSIQSWAMGLVALINSASMSIQGGASNASASLSIYQYIVDSDIFRLLMVIGISLFAVLTAASFLGPCGFLAAMVAPLLVDLLISGMTTMAFSVAGVDNVVTWIAGTIWDILGSELVGGMAGIMGATMGTIGWLASLMSSPVLGDFGGFVLSSIGAILAWVATLVDDWDQSMILNIAGCAIAAYGCYKVFIKPDSNFLKLGGTAKSIIKGITSMGAGISASGLITTVASHE